MRIEFLKENFRFLYDKMKYEFFPRLLSDKRFIEFRYKRVSGKRMNWENPSTFREKLNWMKLYYQDPRMPELVDKAAVKKIVESKVGGYLIPVLGIWDCVDEIPFERLPNQFVLKCTHDSGSTIICRDKDQFDIELAKLKLRHSMKKKYYWRSREWVYKNVTPRIIAEKYMVDESGSQLKDYKFFCFNGKVKFLYIASDRQNDLKYDFFDADFNSLKIFCGHNTSSVLPSKPHNFDKMKELAEILSKGFPHVRVDFYNVYGHIYFSEYTFYHCAGFFPIEPETYDEIWGKYLDLTDCRQIKGT